MVVPLRNPLGSIGMAVSTKPDDTATERPGEQERLDHLFTNLVPELADLSEEQPASKVELGHSPSKPFGSGLDLNDPTSLATPPGGTIASGSHTGANPFKGQFGLSDEALCRLEAGLRAQRNQRVTPTAQPVPARSSSPEPARAADANPPTQRIRRLRLVPFGLLATAIATLVAYNLVRGGSTEVPKNMPASEAIETPRAPDPAAAVQVDQQAKIPVSSDPVPSPAIETKLPLAGEPLPTPTGQAMVPSLPAQITPFLDASVQKLPRARKKHPAARSSR
jgi:hypothetical protein